MFALSATAINLLIEHDCPHRPSVRPTGDLREAAPVDGRTAGQPQRRRCRPGNERPTVGVVVSVDRRAGFPHKFHNERMCQPAPAPLCVPARLHQLCDGFSAAAAADRITQSSQSTLLRRALAKGGGAHRLLSS